MYGSLNSFVNVKLTLRTQLLFTSKLPGLISRCNILAECKYFSPIENNKKQLLVLKLIKTIT